MDDPTNAPDITVDERLRNLETVIHGAGAVLQSGHEAPPADDDGRPLSGHAELKRTVRELRADLEHLRRELATEVRTRRVVVVEEDGFERVVVSGVEVPTTPAFTCTPAHKVGRRTPTAAPAS